MTQNDTKGMPKPSISIIIPVFKRTEWLGRSLEKLGRQNYKGPFEIIVVDDGSPNHEDFQQVLTLFRSPAIRLIRSDHRGPAASRNLGVKESQGEIICFLDDDSFPHEDWLSNIMAAFNNSPEAGIVNGNTLSYDRNLLFPVMLEKYVYHKKCWATCNIAYRRSAFETVGGFDETFREASWEDNDLGLRVTWAGYSHIYTNKAVIHHRHEATLAEYKKKCILNGKGAAVFSGKYFFRKPHWALATPLLMSRHILYCVYPSVWLRKSDSANYLRFLWSLYSLKGFVSKVISFVKQ